MAERVVKRDTIYLRHPLFAGLQCYRGVCRAVSGGPFNMVLCVVLIMFSVVFPVSPANYSSPETKEITAVVMRNFPLQYMTDKDGNPEGFAIDIMDAIADMAGLRVTYLQVDTWNEMFEAVKSGRADLMPNLGITEDRKEWFAFTSPVETFPISIFVRQTTDYIKGEQDLAGQKVAAVKLNVGKRLLENREDIDMIVYDDANNALLELLAGHVDAMVYPEPVLMKMVIDAGLDQKIRTVGAPLAEIKRAISVRKDNTALLERLEPVVDRFVKTKKYRAIYAKWYGKPAPFWTERRAILFMGGGLLAVVFMMGLWRYVTVSHLNRKLKESLAKSTEAEQELVQHIQEMAALNQLGQKVSSNLSFDKIIDTALAEISSIIHPDIVLLFIRDGDDLLLKGCHASDPRFVHKETKVHKVGECLCGLAVTHAKSLFSADINSDPRCTWEECKKAGLRSFAALPLHGGDRIIAVLGIASAKNVDFEKRASFLETLASEVGIGLYNAQLYEEIKKRSEEIERANENLLTEIAERKEAELQLKEISQLNEKIIGASTLGIFVYEASGRCAMANHAAASIIGATLDQVLQQDFTKIRSWQESGLEEVAHKCLSTGTEQKLDVHVTSSFGRKLWLSCTFNTFSKANKKHLLLICEDISRRKQIEEELRHLNTELASKNRELEQVVYVASHDLRTPLVNIEGFSKELGKSFDDLTSIISSKNFPEYLKTKMASIMERDIAESLMYISKSTYKMDSLLSGLLQLSRIGRTELRVEQLDMNSLMLDIVGTIEFLVKKRGVKLEVAQLPSCKGDEIQINQVFSNLIDNALKYLDPGRKGLIKVSGYKEKDGSVYCIEDNGIGIAPEFQVKIFDIFHRLTPEKSSGEGLGLAIVNRVVERHQGRIWVESEPGRGSSFFVSLPD